MYWACAQVEPRRERLASHCLGLAGYEIYQPLLREQRRSRHGHRKITVTPPLFPGYLFVWVVRGWWDARWSPGVVRLIMDSLLPARVPDVVISEIRSRERRGLSVIGSAPRIQSSCARQSKSRSRLKLPTSYGATRPVHSSPRGGGSSQF
jgi:transcription antitermination factor NusG